LNPSRSARGDSRALAQSRVFLQTLGRFAGLKTFSRELNDQIPEDSGVNERFYVHNGVFRQSGAEFIGEAAAIDTQNLHQMNFIGSAHMLNIDVDKRMRK